ncbi:MAG: hypothetical protein WKF95_09160 [Rubrobacter sp.]
MKFSDFDTLTFDVVGTLIDFETGILDWFRPTLKRYGVSKTDEEVLTTFAAVEDRYQRETPEKPFTEMLPLIYRGMTFDWDIGFREEDAKRTRRVSEIPSGLGPLSLTRWKHSRISGPGTGS